MNMYRNCKESYFIGCLKYKLKDLKSVSTPLHKDLFQCKWNGMSHQFAYLSLICRRKNPYLPLPCNTNPGCKLSEKSLKLSFKYLSTCCGKWTIQLGYFVAIVDCSSLMPWKCKLMGRTAVFGHAGYYTVLFMGTILYIPYCHIYYTILYYNATTPPGAQQSGSSIIAGALDVWIYLV